MQEDFLTQHIRKVYCKPFFINKKNPSLVKDFLWGVYVKTRLKRLDIKRKNIGRYATATRKLQSYLKFFYLCVDAIRELAKADFKMHGSFRANFFCRVKNKGKIDSMAILIARRFIDHIFYVEYIHEIKFQLNHLQRNNEYNFNGNRVAKQIDM